MNFFKTEKFWNLIYTFTFLLIIVIVGDYMHIKGYDISMFRPSEFVIVVLASYRMTRLFVYDKVLDFLRDLIVENDSKNGFILASKYFLTCPWCSGVWMTLFVIIMYLFVPFGKLFCYVLAIAGIASFIHIVISLLGWVAEERKFYIKELKKQEKGKANC